MGLLLSFLPWTGIGALAVAVFALIKWKNAAGERDAWQSAWAVQKEQTRAAQEMVAMCQADVRRFRDAADASYIRVAAAVNDAQAIRDRFNVLAAKLRSQPDEPEAQLAWMESVAHDLALEVGHG